MPRLSDYLSMMKIMVERTGLPVPAPPDVTYKWALNGAERPPREGKYYLYTGGLYQLSPYITASVEALARMESLGLMGIASRLSRVVPVSLMRLTVRPRKSDVERAESIVRNAYRLLSGHGVAYPYELDMYTGAILYENGLEHAFQRHIEKVHKSLTERGVTRLITIDPHTTHIMRSVAPKYVDGYRLEVLTYMEFLEDRGVDLSSKIPQAVIHDPCYYARFENIIDQPRSLSSKAGLRLSEPTRSRRMTYCCGGPVEGLMPQLAKKIASARVKELSSYSDTILVMCPICMINLGPAARSFGVKVVDLLEALEPVNQS